jgi:lysozyme family protein
MNNFDKAIIKTLKHEGGSEITNDPTDKGGLTKYGISQKAYPDLDIASLTEDKAKLIYKKDYWDAIKGDEIINLKVSQSIFDFAVNAGPKRSIILAQRASGVIDDGIVGKITLSEWNSVNPELFVRGFAIEKIKFYRDIVVSNHSQRKYIIGWINRALEGL